MKKSWLFLIGAVAIGGLIIFGIKKASASKQLLMRGDLIQEQMNNGSERTLYYDGVELHEILDYNAIDFDQVKNFKSLSENQLAGIQEGGPISC